MKEKRPNTNIVRKKVVNYTHFKNFSKKIFMEFLEASFPPTHEFIATSRVICLRPCQWR